MQISGVTGLLQRVHRAGLLILAVALTAPTTPTHRLSYTLAELNHLRAMLHPLKSPPTTPPAAPVPDPSDRAVGVISPWLLPRARAPYCWRRGDSG